ncbi:MULTISPECIES: hypothetical protein [unclassified Streptomyces]|uniref:hypothetical protein n=1 Tax=unclassified Streptomyces TaxID=2593676 RepID=UPI0037023AF2
MATPAEPGTGADTTVTPGTTPDITTQDKNDKPAESRTGSGGGSDKNWEAEAQTWKARARRWEDQSKEHSATLKSQQAILAKLAEKAGIELDDGKADPQKLAEKLIATEAKARTNAVKLAVFQGAAVHQGDPEALLDSSSFLKRLDGLDPDADDFADKVSEAIKDAVEKNARFKRSEPAASDQTRKPAPKSGTSIPGGPGAPKQYTPDEIKKMSDAEYAKYRQSLGIA